MLAAAGSCSLLLASDPHPHDLHPHPHAACEDMPYNADAAAFSRWLPPLLILILILIPRDCENMPKYMSSAGGVCWRSCKPEASVSQSESVISSSGSGSGSGSRW